MPPTPSAVPGVIRIHHIGVVVRHAEAAAETFRRGLGLDVLGMEEYQDIARVVFLQAGGTLIELIEPLRDGTRYADALRDRGEGAHHVALEVTDLRETLAALPAAVIGVLDPRPHREAGDVLSVFLDPATTGGTLIELVQQIRA